MRVKSYSHLVAFSRIYSEERGLGGRIVVLAPIGPDDPRQPPIASDRPGGGRGYRGLSGSGQRCDPRPSGTIGRRR
jgi:hypothetical protein